MKPACALAALAALAACSGPGDAGGEAAGGKQAAAAGQPPSDSRLPDRVLLEWAKAMSTRDWASAYRYWGNDGQDSGLSPDQFAARWGKLTDPEFELHPGTTRRVDGSLVYTARIVLIDRARRSEGQVVLRRPGDPARIEPQRWQIERLTIQP